MHWGLAVAGLLVAADVSAAGGTVEGTIQVVGVDGAKKEDRSGVVLFFSDVVAPETGARAEIRQKGEEFVPRVSAVPAGTVVKFPNDDSVEHNVFSHSAISEFDLGRYAKGSGKSVTFKRAGVAEIFCNVHKDMVSYVVVAPSKAFALTGADGTFRIENVPPGRHKLTVWHRFSKPRSQTLEIDITDGAVTKFEHDVAEHVAGETPHKNKFGVEYPAGYR